MKKVLLLVLFTLTISQSRAQFGYYHNQKVNYQKYFVSLGYTWATSKWNSYLKNAELLDRDGSTIRTGEIPFTAKNSSSGWDFSVVFPVNKVRFGMGLNFETMFLDKISISTKSNNVVIFDETFTFDKIYGLFEFPFWPESKSVFSLSSSLRAGYFGFHGVKRLNFFGVETLAKSYLAGLSVVGDYKPFPHVYMFISPQCEFKYFKNSHLEYPSIIRHRIFTWGISAGIRVDVSKE